MAKILVERQIKVLVIACNTATTAALTHLRQVLPDVLVIGVVEPGALAAANCIERGEGGDELQMAQHYGRGGDPPLLVCDVAPEAHHRPHI